MTLSNGHGLQPSRPALPAAGLARPAGKLSARWAGAAFAALLAAWVLVLYLPAAGFGLMWDDPLWYAQGAGLPGWQLFWALPTFQFYRPLTLLLTRLFAAPNGVVNAPLAHLVVIGAHLGTVLLAVPVLRALGLAPAHARLTALLAAGLPFAYQAVAWQQAQQPLVMFPLLLALWLAARASARRPRLFLALSAAAYAAALLVHESALLFVFAFVWLAARRRPAGAARALHAWPVLHLALAGAYAVMWLLVPRLPGVTGAGLQWPVLGYGLQALVFPLAAVGAWLWPALRQWPVAALIALYAALAALLAAWAARATSARAALVCVAWAGAGLLPVWVGLSWGYVEIGERLLYPAGLGIAGLWAAPAVWAFAPDPATPGWRRGLGGLALLLALGVSLGQLGQFQRLYRLGTAHLAEAARVLSAAPEGRVLFVNFPDRLGLRPQPYPLGYWGLTLAPVVQDLSGFARAASGQSGADRSLAVFQAGAAVREAWPYRVDLRGADTPPSEVWAAAQWAEAVYLSEYGAAGTLSLRPVGAVRPASAGPVPLALLGGGTELLAAEVVEAPGQPPRLALLWHTSAPQTVDTTIFVHLWRDGAFAGGADGDSLGGVLPPAAWQPEGAVHDLRPLPGLAPGAYRVSVGLYRRWDGQRLPAYTPDGQRLPEDEIFVATVTMP